MGNRVSKSMGWVVSSPIVKEQRVDGGYRILLKIGVIRNPIRPMRLRCILVGFERSYQCKILSKLYYNRSYYSTITKLSSKPNIIKNNLIIDPWAVTGWSDAECSFIVKMCRPKNLVLD